MKDFVCPKNDLEWRAATGMDERRFSILLLLFEDAYVSHRIPSGGQSR